MNAVISIPTNSTDSLENLSGPELLAAFRGLPWDAFLRIHLKTLDRDRMVDLYKRLIQATPDGFKAEFEGNPE